MTACTTQPTVKLDPRKPSALLRTAVADCLKVKALSNVVFDMDTWVEGPDQPNGPCSVCMAGAVMIGTLGAPLPEMYSHRCPSSFRSDGTYSALLIINMMRTGEDYEVMRELEAQLQRRLEPHESRAVDLAMRKVRRRFHPGLGRSPWSDYLQAAKRLEAAGL